MAMITYPLNDVEYTAEDAELYNCTRTSGVYSGEDFSCTVSGTNNNVTIGEGVGWISNSRFSGKVFANKAPVTLALDIADAANPRIDIVAVRFDAATNTTDLVIKKGTAAASPVMPEIVQTESVYELYLFSVYRETAATAITADNVTDLRLDASVCGLMADAVSSVDTSAINAQFTALLEKIKQELADLKHDKIDAYTKEETLSPTTKTALGLSEDAVPDDAFGKLSELNLHWWKRRTEESGYVLAESVGTFNFGPITSSSSYNIAFWYYDDITINAQTGEITLSEQQYVSGNYAFGGTFVNAMRGKYFCKENDTANMYYMPENATSGGHKESGSSYYIIFENVVKLTPTLVTDVGEYEYVSSPNRNAYPDSGTEGIFSYQYLGVPFENAREGAKVVTGSYVGTGTYGESNPNTLTFDSVPKIIMLWTTKTVGSSGYSFNPHILRWGVTAIFANSSSNSASYKASVTYSGNTMTWYSLNDASYQANTSGTTYYYLAIL